MQGINKSFGDNPVLTNAGFQLTDGEIHALMGENGAGKSTLMKILTGVYTRDAGIVKVDGQEVIYKNPQEAEKAGIVFIHQELNLINDLPVYENMFIGREIRKRSGFIDHKEYGPTYQYFAKVSREEYNQRSLVGLIDKYFDNSYINAVSALVKEEKISVEELKELIKLIEKEK